MTDIDVTVGSGNVFADLGIENAEEELIKAQLTYQIHTAIKERGLTQTKAAALLGVHQPQVSMLMRNRSGNFSVARLMRFLTALGRDIEITVRPKATEQASGRVQLVVQSSMAANA